MGERPSRRRWVSSASSGIVAAIDSLLDSYAVSRLAAVSADRRRASLQVLADLASHIGTDGLPAVDRTGVEAFLSERRVAGEAPGTLRKKRAIIAAFSGWAYDQGMIGAERLLDVRAARTPVGASRSAAPRPYLPGELRELRARLDARWPRFGEEQAERWLSRFRDGRSPYSRVRSHVIRCQLDAVIAQALHLGLRRGEVFRLDVVSGHPDNDELIVYRDSSRVLERARSVPNTTAARAAMAGWTYCRWALRAGHAALWLSTHARTTASAAMTRDTLDRLLRTCVGPGWTMKRLRDTCAVAWLRAGLAPEHVRQLLGLSAIEGVLPYMRLVPGALGVAVNRAEERFELALR